MLQACRVQQADDATGLRNPSLPLEFMQLARNDFQRFELVPEDRDKKQTSLRSRAGSFSFFVVYAPNYLGHPDNYIEADPMVTPPHIVPEWYFLPFYAILRTIPDKLGGVVLMVLAILILLLLPILDSSFIRSNFFKPFHLFLFWFFVADCLMLGWVGQEVVETPFIELSTIITPLYFMYFLVLIPFFSNLEKELIKHYNK